jgi:hypothetical protein
VSKNRKSKNKNGASSKYAQPSPDTTMSDPANKPSEPHVVSEELAEAEKWLLHWRETINRVCSATETRGLTCECGASLIEACHEPPESTWGLTSECEVIGALRTVTQERDEARAELSAAFGLPPTVGPCPGEAKRIVEHLRDEVKRLKTALSDLLVHVERLVRERDEAKARLARGPGRGKSDAAG